MKQVQVDKGLKLNIYEEENLSLKFGMFKKRKMILKNVSRGVELEKLLLLLLKYKRLSLLKEQLNQPIIETYNNMKVNLRRQQQEFQGGWHCFP